MDLRNSFVDNILNYGNYATHAKIPDFHKLHKSKPTFDTETGLLVSRDYYLSHFENIHIKYRSPYSLNMTLHKAPRSRVCTHTPPSQHISHAFPTWSAVLWMCSISFLGLSLQPEQIHLQQTVCALTKGLLERGRRQEASAPKCSQTNHLPAWG